VDKEAQHWQSAKFFVTNNTSPVYDIVLGRRDANKFGMLSPEHKD
jgi:hypothetical protein